jgi:hypothetical protein
MIHVYNIHNEDHSNEECCYYCGRHRNKYTNRNDNPLGNPFTHNGVKTSIANLSFKTREEAIAAFGEYFDKAYGVDEELTTAFDKIYENYKNGKEIWLGCFCKPLSCHCDIIADRLQRKLIKEKLEERKKLKNSKS